MTKALSGQGGMSLIEVLVAMALFTICGLGMIYMQTHALFSSSDTSFRTKASRSANAALAQILADVPNLRKDYAYSGATVPAKLEAWDKELKKNLPAAEASIAFKPVSGTQFASVKISIKWHRPGSFLGVGKGEYVVDTVVANINEADINGVNP